MNKVFVLHPANMDLIANMNLISNATCGPQTLYSSDYWAQNQEKALALMNMASQPKRMNLIWVHSYVEYKETKQCTKRNKLFDEKKSLVVTRGKVEWEVSKMGKGGSTLW